MKYRMTSASALPLALSVAGNAVAFRKAGDSVELELTARGAERIARYGAVRFEAIVEPAHERAPEPVEETPVPGHAEPPAFTPADLITTETPPAETDATTE